jgi:uncharacterized integral membrane protein
MFWIKLIIGIAVFVVVLIFGLEFASVNTDQVSVNYVLGSVKQPLALVVVWAFFLGFLITVVVSFFIIMPLRWRLNRLKRTVSSQEQEINTLLRKSARSAP